MFLYRSENLITADILEVSLIDTYLCRQCAANPIINESVSLNPRCTTYVFVHSLCRQVIVEEIAVHYRCAAKADLALVVRGEVLQVGNIDKLYLYDKVKPTASQRTSVPVPKALGRQHCRSECCAEVSECQRPRSPSVRSLRSTDNRRRLARSSAHRC